MEYRADKTLYIAHPLSEEILKFVNVLNLVQLLETLSDGFKFLVLKAQSI